MTVAFSKSLASVGGAVMTTAPAADGIRASALPYVFSAANDPASVGAALAALRILRSEPERMARTRENGELLRAALAEAGPRRCPGRGAVIAVPTGEEEVTAAAWRVAFDAGVYVQRRRLSGRPRGEGRAAAVGHGHAHRRAAARAAEVVGAAVQQARASADRTGRRRLTGGPASLSVTAMADSRPAAERRGRALIGWWAASALVYPLLVCAVQLVRPAADASTSRPSCSGWPLGVACSVALVAAVRWGAARRVRSPWLLLGLAPPALYELWLVWPQFAA